MRRMWLCTLIGISLFILTDGMAGGAEKEATFAGGCFWCVEEIFDHLPGVVSAVSGYTGGKVKNPTYEQVSAGGTGHVEAVRVVYDTSKTSYAALLDTFWKNIDPTDAGGQFCDRGSQYRSVIFYHDDEQRREAQRQKAELDRSGKLQGAVATAILPAAPFYAAEEYHQNYAVKNPLRYRYYRLGCGRDRRLDKVWHRR